MDSKVQNDSEGRLIVTMNRMKPACYLFMGVCILITAVLALTQPLPFAENPLMIRIMTGVIGGTMSLALIAINLNKVVRKNEAIRIDEKGVTDRTGALAPGFIAWEDVKEVFVLRLKDDDYLCVLPNDQEAWMNSLNKRQRSLAQANLDAGFAPMRIQFKKATDLLRAKDGLEAGKRFCPKKVTRTRKPKY